MLLSRRLQGRGMVALTIRAPTSRSSCDCTIKALVFYIAGTSWWIWLDATCQHQSFSWKSWSFMNIHELPWIKRDIFYHISSISWRFANIFSWVGTEPERAFECPQPPDYFEKIRIQELLMKYLGSVHYLREAEGWVTWCIWSIQHFCQSLHSEKKILF